ncbi:hypothetical protein BKA80DRAFT_26548 [Phyllosticta citrichinensis]
MANSTVTQAVPAWSIAIEGRKHPNVRTKHKNTTENIMGNGFRYGGKNSMSIDNTPRSIEKLSLGNRPLDQPLRSVRSGFYRKKMSFLQTSASFQNTSSMYTVLERCVLKIGSSQPYYAWNLSSILRQLSARAANTTCDVNRSEWHCPRRAAGTTGRA